MSAQTGKTVRIALWIVVAGIAAAAACRVGLELLRCANPAQILSATPRGPQASTAACSGVSPEEVQQGWSYVTRAAGGGSVAAQHVSLARSVEAASPEECGR